ncbi:Hypothetical predicted protein [Mytilus galloprovincialis]|uniref:Uncharacterized protein n=1 Tax=Mytilus galloprovincialis TaxID=29158 RepID=A0A8B6GE80_MYTGA|nr:Hypothetical predicted protein [Mytilus galloprovincialis]
MSNQQSENPDNDKIATSYVLVLKQNNNNFSKDNAEPDGEYFSVKPVFILESDIFGNSKPDKNNYLTHTELFRCIDLIIPTYHLNRLQRVIGGVWRMYPDNEKDRDTLVVNSIHQIVSEESTEESGEESENESEKDDEIVSSQSTENHLHTDDTPQNEQNSKITELTKDISKVDEPEQNLSQLKSEAPIEQSPEQN